MAIAILFIKTALQQRVLQLAFVQTEVNKWKTAFEKSEGTVNDLGAQLKATKTDAMTDFLSGLGNLRSLTITFDFLLALAKREQRVLTMIHADIVGLKSINDTYSHNVGSQVIRCLATAFKRVLRRDFDFVARVGGDEFAVLLYDNQIDMPYDLMSLVKATFEEELESAVLPKTGLRYNVYSQKMHRYHDLTLEAMLEEADAKSKNRHPTRGIKAGIATTQQLSV